MNHLRDLMLSLYNGTLRKEAAQKAQHAIEDSNRFSTDAVRELLFDRMEEVRQLAV